MARSSSRARPSRFSRRSNRPAQVSPRRSSTASGPSRRALRARARRLRARGRRPRRGALRRGRRLVRGQAPSRRARRHSARRTTIDPRRVGLELDEVAAERQLETGQGCLDAIGRTAQRGLTVAGRRRIGLAARPALEQPAEREGRDFERDELGDQAPPGDAVTGMLGDQDRPVRTRLRGRRQTSTTTGRIIGRRRVRS